MKILKMFLVLCSLFCGLLVAQSPQTADSTQQSYQNQPSSSIPVYRVTVIARTMKAINYQHQNGATKIDLLGTDLQPAARAEAKVESKKGYIEIEVEFDDMEPATRYGNEYLTYVLWAITPEGRTSNLGEILLDGGTKSKLNVTTELQVFGLAVTAEPYFAVNMPSNLVVMENALREDTVGRVEEMDAMYELLQRGEYDRLANPLVLQSDPKVPLQLYEARNAVQIARAAGAERLSSDTFTKAENSLNEAEAYQSRKADRKQVIRASRAAVQTAEDSRAISVRRLEEERLASERQASAVREASAKAEAESEALLRAQAEKDQRMEADKRALAESETAMVKDKAEAARIAAQNEAIRIKQENDNARDTAKAMADQASLAAAQAAADRSLLATQEADRLRLDAEAARIAAQNEADRIQRVNDDARNAAKAQADQAARKAALGWG